MKLQVISEDASLLALCREVASEFPDTVWRLGLAPDDQADLDVDLCIWDYRAGLPIPEKARWASKHFVLVRSNEIGPFRSAHPYAEGAIVLKPVTRVVMRTLMEQAIACATRHTEFEKNSIRSDRDDILQCLLEANLRLQQYEAGRTSFLGRALHDFHAPLTALSGYCGLLVEQRIGVLNEEQKLIINRMRHSVRRLSRMSRAMFQLSVGRHVDLKPALREGDVRECAEQAVYEVQQFAQEKQLQFDIQLDPSAEHLSIDSGQIEQVIVNLLENACKFSPCGGTVVLKGYPWFWERRAMNVTCATEAERRMSKLTTPNAYRVDVGDSGPGISPEHLSPIFEEYVSYSGGQDRSGGGLGLAICRLILTQHQGTIWAQNNTPGAVFSFVLPLHGIESADTSAEIISASFERNLSRTSVWPPERKPF